MKKPLLIVIVLILIVGTGGVVWWYINTHQKAPGESSNILEPEQNIPAAKTPDSQNIPPSSQNVVANDNFSLTYLDGWKSVPPPQGVSAMVVKQNEMITDPQAKKMNFQTYLAVSYGFSDGKSKEQVIQELKTQLKTSLPGTVFSNEKFVTINGNDAYAMELSLSQNGADFHILMIAIWGKGNDIWTLSFNTLESLWADYADSFGEITQSFLIK
jgi:flagellar basal body-associated protein FliL